VLDVKLESTYAKLNVRAMPPALVVTLTRRLIAPGLIVPTPALPPAFPALPAPMTNT
jgi:hypothetical protein